MSAPPSANEHILGTAAWLILPLAEKAEVYPHHWIGGGGGWNASFSFCGECAEKEINRLISKGANPHHTYIDGGYGWPEEENTRRCDGSPPEEGHCGRLLEYSLIDRSGELDHFEALTDKELKAMDAESAHELLCVLQGCDPEYHQEDNDRRTRAVAVRIIRLFGYGVVREIDGVLAATIGRMKEAE